MRQIFNLLVLLTMFGIFSGTSEAQNSSGDSRLSVLEQLPVANANFVNNLSHGKNLSACRSAIAKNPQPQFVVICGTDPRVSPEIIFDAMLGDFCVIRSAGNLVTPQVLEEVDFCINTYGMSNILILGNKSDDLLKAYVGGANSSPLLKNIDPALSKYISSKAKEEEKISKTAEVARQNLIIEGNKLMESGDIASQIKRGRINFMRMLYDPETGAVEAVNE